MEIKRKSLVDDFLGLVKHDYRTQQALGFSLDDGTKVAQYCSGLFKIEAELSGVDSKSFSMDQSMKGFSLDDDSFFTSRALENIDATVRFWKSTVQLLLRVDLTPWKNDIPVGINIHTWQFYDFTGKYKRSQANNTDLPTAQVKGVEDKVIIHPGTGAIGWNRMELDAAQFANAPLEATKAKAIFRAYGENIHQLMIDPERTGEDFDTNPLLKGWMRSDIDEFAVMPNHIHGIIVIVGATPRGCPVLPPRGCPGVGQENGQVRGYRLTGKVRRISFLTESQEGGA